MDCPLYLPRTKINYLQYEIDSEYLIWRDDSRDSPVFINIRSCISEYFLFLEAFDSNDIFKLRSYNQKDWIEPYMDYINHYNVVEYFKKLAKTELENEMQVDQWIKSSLGSFIIFNYPNLISSEEKLLVDKYKNNLVDFNRVEKVPAQDNSVTTEQPEFLMIKE